MKEVDVKYIIRFLKDEGIYKRTIAVISYFLLKNEKNYTPIQFIKSFFIINGSCRPFFEWLDFKEYDMFGRKLIKTRILNDYCCFEVNFNDFFYEIQKNEKS